LASTSNDIPLIIDIDQNFALDALKVFFMFPFTNWVDFNRLTKSQLLDYKEYIVNSNSSAYSVRMKLYYEDCLHVEQYFDCVSFRESVTKLNSVLKLPGWQRDSVWYAGKSMDQKTVENRLHNEQATDLKNAGQCFGNKQYYSR